jgi:CubicO group peptidase (beta-lactamase class C family)
MRLDSIGGQPIMYCCYLSTPSDWLRLGHLLINDGKIDGEQIIPEGWVDEMKTTSVVNPNYGYQIWVGSPPGKKRAYLPTIKGGNENYHSELFAANDIFFMDGSVKIRMWMVPSEDLVILRMGRNAPNFDEARLPNTILRGIK